MIFRIRCELYSGHGRLCVCMCLYVSVSDGDPRPQCYTDPDVTWGNGRGAL